MWEEGIELKTEVFHLNSSVFLYDSTFDLGGRGRRSRELEIGIHLMKKMKKMKRINGKCFVFVYRNG